MKVRHLLLVVEHIIRSLVGWHCTPVEAPAGTVGGERCDIPGEERLSIPARERCGTAVGGRFGIVVLERSDTAGEGHSDIPD